MTQNSHDYRTSNYCGNPVIYLTEYSCLSEIGGDRRDVQKGLCFSFFEAVKIGNHSRNLTIAKWILLAWLDELLQIRGKGMLLFGAV
jgi:hypothetical protein